MYIAYTVYYTTTYCCNLYSNNWHIKIEIMPYLYNILC